MLTDAQIDGLDGVELNLQVAIAAGWQTERWGIGQHIRWIGPLGEMSMGEQPPEFDLGAAMGLLMGCPDVKVHWGDATITVSSFRYDRDLVFTEIATGPKSSAASIICRAYLKIKNGSVG